MEESIQKIREAIVNYNGVEASECARQAIEQGIPPIDILGAMTDAIREVGDKFGKGELWLPDLVGAGSAMQAAIPIVEAAIVESGGSRESQGVIVIGTVFGDIHNIGKDMVATLLTAGGFEVHDLGINIPADQFVEAVTKYNADILAMSALLTTTSAEQRRVIKALEDRGIRPKVRVIVAQEETE